MNAGMFQNEMYQLLEDLFPICRSLTGEGVRQTLARIQKHIPLKIYEVPSGTKAFDWVVPKEWNISNAYVKDETGNKIVDFKENNLHIVGYSVPVDCWVSLAELQEHLFSLEDQPEAIPYVTSYYNEQWGFCISHQARSQLKEGRYHVVIESELKEGSLTYAELIIPGKSEQEILIATYVCHPSMANNELSGPVVATFIAKWVAMQPRRYTYRFVFSPETIGAITYLSRHKDVLENRMIAGFNLSCIGDERTYSYVASRYGSTLADKVAENVIKFICSDYKKYSFLSRGSDERQYCSPGIDLPLVTLCRSKFGEYPEYHTSLDNLDLVTGKGLYGGYRVVKECLQTLECNEYYTATCFGEPQLGKRGLYPNLSVKRESFSVKSMMDFIAYADGTNDVIDISNRINVSVNELIPIIEKLVNADLLKKGKEVAAYV